MCYDQTGSALNALCITSAQPASHMPLLWVSQETCELIVLVKTLKHLSSARSPVSLWNPDTWTPHSMPFVPSRSLFLTCPWYLPTLARLYVSFYSTQILPLQMHMERFE